MWIGCWSQVNRGTWLLRKKYKLQTHTHCCPIFGYPKALNEINLPTYEDLLLNCFEESYEISVSSESKKRLAFSTIADILVATQIEMIYFKASITVVTHTRIVQMIKSYHDLYYTLRKSYNRDKNKERFKQKYKISWLKQNQRCLTWQHVNVLWRLCMYKKNHCLWLSCSCWMQMWKGTKIQL